MARTILTFGDTFDYGLSGSTNVIRDNNKLITSESNFDINSPYKRSRQEDLILFGKRDQNSGFVEEYIENRIQVLNNSSSMGYTIPERINKNNIFTIRFNESDKFTNKLDIESREYSSYNDLNLRNYSLRNYFNYLLSIPSSFGGIQSGSQNVTYVDIETAYLPLNGTDEYGYIANVLNGIGALDTWTTAIKVERVVSNGVAYDCWMYAYDNTVAPLNTLFNRVWTIVQNTTGVYTGKANAAGSVAINLTDPASGVENETKIIVITQSPGTVKVSFVISSGLEGTRTHTYDSATYDRSPLHLAMGGQLNESHGIMVPTQMGTARNIAMIVVNGEIPVSELTNWITNKNAKNVISNLRNYWPLAQASGASVPDIINGQNMTLVNIDSSSLVSL